MRLAAPGGSRHPSEGPARWAPSHCFRCSRQPPPKPPADPAAFGREGEGEEESSVMLDDGMNDLAAVQAKFAKFDEEKQVRDRW
jgi:hypothetical protein